MATKRKLEFSDYSKLEIEANNADIHGVVTSLSPVKKSRVGSNYYTGQVCDGKQKLRLVGFSTSQQKQLDELKDKKQSVEIQNCQIKKSIRDSDKFEILLKGATKILPSPKKFDVSPLEYDQDRPKEVLLSAVNDLPIHTLVTVKVKVANCSAPVSRGTKTKQSVTIADKSGTFVVQLWEEHVGELEEQRSYILKTFRVSEYEDNKYLAMVRDSEIVPTDDITDAVELEPVPLATESTYTSITNPRIAAVYKLQSFKICIRCHSPVEPQAAPLGRCTKSDCGILQDYTLCDTTNVAELLVIDGAKKLILFAYDDCIAEIAGTPNPTEHQLLTAPLITQITYNQENKIIAIQRP